MQDENFSVDVRAWMRDWSTEVLLEVKWTRKCFSVARAEGKKKIQDLKRACSSGRWLQANGKPGKAIKATAVGVLVVGPESWDCEVQSAIGTGKPSFPSKAGHVPRKRRSGVSNWEKWRGDAAAGTAGGHLGSLVARTGTSAMLKGLQ